MNYDELSHLMTGASGDAVVLRLVDLHGFGGGNRSHDIAFLSKDAVQGSILSPGVTTRLLAKLGGESGFVRASVSDDDAVEAGLACGGWVSALYHPKSWLPELKTVFEERKPFALLTELGESGPKSLRVQTRDGDDGLQDDLRDVISAGLRKASTGTRLVEANGRQFHIQFFSPDPRVLVLGSGELAEEIKLLVEHLGMSCSIGLSVPDGYRLGPIDGIVVLTHDHDLATPILESFLLTGPPGYVASLGSRETQNVRRQRLEALGIDSSCLYGPAGLDIGSRSSAETALSIVAEMLAVTRGRNGGHLKNGTGPING
jgi:xanthine dehydrogenase accessory factor